MTGTTIKAQAAGPGSAPHLRPEDRKTGHVKSEETARFTGEEYLNVFMAIPAPISITTVRDPHYIEVNEAFQEMCGYGRDEIIGRSVAEVGIWPRTEQWDYVARLLEAHGRVRDLEFHLRAKTGGERILLSSAELITRGKDACILFMAMDITQRKRAEESLRQTNAYNRGLIEASLDPLIMIGPDGAIRDANGATELITGLSRDALAGTEFADYFTEPQKAREACRQVFRAGLVRDVPLDVRRRDGGVASVLYSASVCWDEDGGVIGAVGGARDITERKQAETRLAESEERYRTAIEHSNDGVAIATLERQVYVNQRFLSMFGYDYPEEINGDGDHREVHPDDREMVREYHRKRLRGEPSPSRYEYKGIKKDGTVIFVEASVAATVHQGQPASLAYLRDVTERKRMEERLRTISIIDELTGLYNRRGFLTLAQQQLNLSERTGEVMELFFMDLDGLKPINDALGHQEGDHAIMEAADVLRVTFRRSDIIGRMGGDEFAVFAINAGDRNKERLVARLHDTLDRFNRASRRKYTLSLSVGAVQYDPEHPISLDKLITGADALMYQEKRGKKPGARDSRF